MPDDSVLKCAARRFPELGSLPAELADAVRRDAREVHYAAGETLFDEGSPCAAFLLVVSGGVRVTRSSSEGREILLYHLRPGETCVMTLACLLGERTYAGRGTVTETLHAAALPRPLFDDLIAGVPAFRRRIFASVADRLADLGSLVEEVAFHRLDRRLAALVLRRADPGGVLSSSHQELADELGSVREMVSRTLEAFAARGAVQLDRRRITVIDRGILEALAGDR